jgi:hypothetical protein
VGRPVPADYSRGWQKILQQRSITRPLLKHKVKNCGRILVWHEDGHLQLKYGSRIITLVKTVGCFGIIMHNRQFNSH